MLLDAPLCDFGRKAPEFTRPDADGGLRYRGRLDDAGRDGGRDAGRRDPPDSARELVDAMRLVAGTGRCPAVQTPSMGCSIKGRRPRRAG